MQNDIIQNVMNYENEAVDMWEIESNADLLLINSYEVLNNIRPSVPTTVYLGGIHQSKRTELSHELREFLKKSECAVYVNLNGFIHYNPMRLEKLLTALEKANVDIIWNLNDGDYINSTARIYQTSEMDQESILGELLLSIIECK